MKAKFTIRSIFKAFLPIFIVGSFDELIAQPSSSVFDANYFASSEQQPPIKAGKGFDIRDVYRPTMYCFTDAYRSVNLKAEETGQHSTITLHYTKNDTEFNELKKSGGSGKISYLNLFSMGGQNLKEFAQTTLHTQERIVFVAKVDFGLYEFDTNPVLLPEASALLNEKNYDEFINKYGTHYIFSVRKGASIYVVLTRKNAATTTGSNELSSFSMGVNSLFKVGANFEVSEEQALNEQLRSNEFTVSVEVNGPSLAKANLESSISKMLKANDEDKLAGIKELIGRAAATISDPSQAKITQYYYSPFSMLGGKNVNWSSKKENVLEQINMKVIETYAVKSKIDKLVGIGAPDYLKSEYDGLMTAFTFPEKDAYKQKLVLQYNKLLPALTADQKALENALVTLEKNYNACVDVSCDPSMACCTFPTNQNISDMNYKVNKEIKQLLDIEADAFNAALRFQNQQDQVPECEKNYFGTVQIINKSSNPYLIYDNKKYVFTIPGGGETTINVELGLHTITAEQKSGYLMYATVNNRDVEIVKACDAFAITIGYED